MITNLKRTILEDPNVGQELQAEVSIVKERGLQNTNSRKEVKVTFAKPGGFLYVLLLQFLKFHIIPKVICSNLPSHTLGDRPLAKTYDTSIFLTVPHIREPNSGQNLTAAQCM
jgi:hypothetical protein